MLVSYSVKVRLIQGKDLLACDSNGKSDPYCRVWIGVLGNTDKKAKKTHTKKKTLTPVWDETFVFPVNNPMDEKIFIEMWDWDIGKDDAMGGVCVPLTGLVQSVERVDWYPLSSQGGLQIGLTAVAFDSSGLNPQELATVYAGNIVDSTQIPRYQPPPRWQVEDPEKFYSMNKHDHRSGWIQLAMDKPYYIGGEIIKGTVTLNLREAIPAHAVKIKWNGSEKTYIENTVDNRVNVYKGHKEFFNTTTILFQNPSGHSTIPPGSHVWPFMFTLPPNLPSSFFEKYIEFDGDKVKASIAYKVKVFVDMPGSDIKAKEKLIIAELLTQRVLPVAETKVKSFAFSKGKIRFTGEMGKNVLIPGEVVPIHIKFNNPTNKPVQNIKIKLIRKLTIKAQILSKTTMKEMAVWKFPGQPKGVDWDGMVEVQLPEKIYPSSEGTLTQCSYIMSIELDLPWAFDLIIHPKIVLALLPAPGQAAWFFQDMSQLGNWKSW